MEELIYLLIKLIGGALEGAGGGAKRRKEQELQSRLAWEQRLAWERKQRELQQMPVLPPPVPVRPARPRVAPAPAMQVRRGAEEPGPARAPSAAREAVAGAIRRPRTLRDRFVLTEILRPPLTLRPPQG